MESDFKAQTSLEERKQQFQDIHENYPDKIPVVCQKSKRSKIKPLEKTKYLIDCDFPVSNFEALIRGRLEMTNIDGLFFFVNKDNKKLISLRISDQPMSEIYNEFKDEDGFLYIFFDKEQIWG